MSSYDDEPLGLRKSVSILNIDPIALQSPEVDQPTWYNHYYKHTFKANTPEQPKPAMFNGKPVWRGGLRPEFGLPIEEDYEYVCDFNFRYTKVHFKRIKDPTNLEYVKYFKTHIEKARYKLVSHYEGDDYRVRVDFYRKK